MSLLSCHFLSVAITERWTRGVHVSGSVWQKPEELITGFGLNQARASGWRGPEQPDSSFIRLIKPGVRLFPANCCRTLSCWDGREEAVGWVAFEGLLLSRPSVVSPRSRSWEMALGQRRRDRKEPAPSKTGPLVLAPSPALVSQIF